MDSSRAPPRLMNCRTPALQRIAFSESIAATSAFAALTLRNDLTKSAAHGASPKPGGPGSATHLHRQAERVRVRCSVAAVDRRVAATFSRRLDQLGDSR